MSGWVWAGLPPCLVASLGLCALFACLGDLVVFEKLSKVPAVIGSSSLLVVDWTGSDLGCLLRCHSVPYTSLTLHHPVRLPRLSPSKSDLAGLRRTFVFQLLLLRRTYNG